MERFQYYAFISYSRKDEYWAKWLQKKLENYKLPSVIRKEHESKMPLRPVFVDKTDLGTGNLDSVLTKDLEDSRFLIVICSPSAAVSGWVEKEVARFSALGRKERIIPFIVDGSPVVAQNSPLQCYPSTLDKAILGASVKELGKERAFIKVVAKMLGLRADDLWQRHLRAEKRKKIIRYSVSAFLVLAISVTSFWIWDHYYRVTKKYYADFVDRWGLPVGIIELSPGQVSRRNYSYEFDFKAGKVRAVKRVNSSGSIVSAPFEKIVGEGAPQSTYDYLEDENLDKKNILDIYGAVLVVAKFSSKNEIDFKNVNGKVTTLYNSTSGYSVLGNLDLKNTINRYSLTRNEKGEVTKVVFGNGIDAVCDANGIYGKSYQLDSLGRVVTEIYLDNIGNPKPDNYGIAKEKYEYDRFGNKSSISYLNNSDALVMNEDGWAKLIYEADENGNVIKVSFLDINKNSCFSIDGFAITKAEYDGNGRLLSRSFFNTENKRCLNKDGVSKLNNQYDRKGILIAQENFDINDKSCFSNDGYAIVKWENGKQHLLISYFDTLKKPCYNNNRYSIVKKDFDGKGYLQQEAYFDPSGNPCLSSEGFAILTHKTDEDGNEIEVAAFGKDNKPCYTSEGYSVLKAKWDKKGNGTEIAYFDTKGRPTYCNERYSIMRLKYTERGNVSSLSFFGTDSLPCFIDDGESGIEYKYDFEKNTVLLSFMGIDSNICINKDWVSGGLIHFDERGKPLEMFSVDESGMLSLNKNGFAFKKIKNDIYGNRVKESYFGVDSTAVLCDEGYANMVSVYNNSNQLIEDRFYGLDDNLINRGVAIEKVKYDERGNQIEIAFFNNDSIATDGPDAVAKKKMIYDARNRIIQASYYNSNDELTLNKDKIAIKRFEYDEVGFQIKLSYFDEHEMPCLNNDKISVQKYKNDDRNNLLEVYNYGVDGNLCLNNDSTAIYKYIYDDKMHMIQQEFFGVSGKPANNKNGFLNVIKEYDPRGNVIVEYYPEGILLYPSLGKYVSFFNSKDQNIKNIYYNKNGQICKAAENKYSIEKIKYNEKGLQEELAYYDENNTPAPGIGHNMYKVMYEYNIRGVLTRSCYYDLDERKKCFTEK